MKYVLDFQTLNIWLRLCRYLLYHYACMRTTTCVFNFICTVVHNIFADYLILSMSITPYDTIN